MGLSSSISRDKLYVACSRATSVNGLYIKGSFVPPTKPPSNDPVTIELERLKQNPLQLSHPFLQDLPVEKHKLLFQNVQSFRKNGQYLMADHSSVAADIICLVETKLPELEGFTYAGGFTPLFIGRAKRTGNSINSEGGLILTKSGKLHV